MFDPITLIAGWLGIDPAILLATIPIVVLIANFLSRAIPDDSTGVLGVIHKIAKVLGLYLSNRISSGVSINSVVKEQVPAIEQTAANASAKAANANAKANLAASEVDSLKKTFNELPAKQERDGAGKFKPKNGFIDLSLIWFLIPLVVLGIMLAGCTDRQVISGLCDRQLTARPLAEQTLAAAQRITDPVRREAQIAIAEATLAILDGCPPVGAN